MTELDGLSVSVFDSQLYSPLFTQKEMKEIWADKNLIQCWLTYEIALANAQATCGVIPAEAVAAINEVCQLEYIDWTRLANETEHVGMAIKPLIDQLSASEDRLVQRYLHWGGTTQDVLDTSLAMRVKQSLSLLKAQLVKLADALVLMIDKHRHTVMVARTNSMDALPTTWGLHVSGYLREITLHLDRLASIAPRATSAVFGGAVGNLSSIGDKGLDVRKALFSYLELPEPWGLANASMDGIVELIQYHAIVHGTLCRIANDVETMGRAPIAEVREGESGGGSSTMPHKANPRASNMIQTLSRMGWMYASGAPNLMDQRDVRSASMRVLNWSLVPESSLALSTSLERAERLISHLIVDSSQMEANFNASRYFVMGEAVMMKAAEIIGRGEGYRRVKLVIENAPKDGMLKEVLLQNGDIKALLGSDVIESACDPRNYLGCNDALIDETLERYSDVRASAVAQFGLD